MKMTTVMQSFYFYKTRKEKLKEKLKNLRKNEKPFKFNIQKNILFTYALLLQQQFNSKEY